LLSGKIKYILFLIFVVNTIDVYGQSAGELDFILVPDSTQKNETGKKKLVSKPQISEINLLLNGLIITYQTLLSSQQSPQICTFTPSCSQFGYISIKKYGAFWGLLMTSDRFVRCHNFNFHYYQFDFKSGKLIDPVDYYYIGYWW
jgi:putative component of membrane protein insertase Oxa1/YidC/SpoIIIJ protein YidD